MLVAPHNLTGHRPMHLRILAGFFIDQFEEFGMSAFVYPVEDLLHLIWA